MKKNINAIELYNELLESEVFKSTGKIIFSFAGVNVQVNTTDTVGNSIQLWVGQYLTENNYNYSQPKNTQQFPDYYLDINSKTEKLLEVKTFNFHASPAFDIANFESYCDTVKSEPYKLNADYLVFGYTMDNMGNISFEKIWLKKIWELAGKSKTYDLRTQVKRGVIYNIRPNSEFKRDKVPPFKNKEEFLNAIYKTLIKYKDEKFAEEWKNTIKNNYFDYYNEKLMF